MRSSEVKRKTAETDIFLRLNIDGNGNNCINTGCGFLDHMLTLFSRHSGFDLEVECKGDTYVDYHHSTEDIGICLGIAFSKALGEKTGIFRYSDRIVPMDESLVLAAADISGRGQAYIDLDIPAEKVGDFDTELCEEFWVAFARNAGVTLHLRQITGKNSHHIIEACFKACARCLSDAAAINDKHSDQIPSSKGVL